MCIQGSIGSLQSDLRRMNEHRKLIHEVVPLNKEQLDLLEQVPATKASQRKSWTEVKTVVEDDFRSESLLESRLGLLKTCVFFQGQEEALETGDFFWRGQDSNPFIQEVIQIFERAETLCGRPGSSLVRQQAKRDAENNISAKVFMPVSRRKTLNRYAETVSHLVYFCTKATWTTNPQPKGFRAKEILKQVLFEENTKISQTFMTRCVWHHIIAERNISMYVW